MKFFRSPNLWILCTLLLLPGITGCDKKAEEDTQTAAQKLSAAKVVHGGIYRAPLLNNPATIDPAGVQDQYGTAVVQQLFDGLVRFDAYLLVLPALAESWQIKEGGKVYRFTLQENALFHNGEPVTAADVVFSLSRLLRIDPAPAVLPHLLKIVGAKAYRDGDTDAVAGMVSVDERTVEVQLEAPYAPFLTALGMYQAKIVPEAEVLRLKDEFGKKPIGSGPFQFVSWEPNKQIRLKQFPGYYAGDAYLDGVEYAIYPGVGIDQILSDFRDGKLEEMGVTGQIRQELPKEKGLQWFHRPSLSLMFYGLRVNKPLLDNPDFRRALSMAIDREKLISQVYEGQLEPARSILPPGMPGFNTENQLLTDDFATAHAIIRPIIENQKESISSIEIVSNSKSAFAQAELNLLRDAWADLGIDLKIKYITDWSQFEAYLQSDAVQLYRYAWFADMPDPDSFLYSLFASESPANLMDFNDQKVDEMLLSARGEVDPVKRIDLYREIENRIMKASPLIPLVYLSVDRVYGPHVRGAQPSALGEDYMSLHRVWLETKESTS